MELNLVLLLYTLTICEGSMLVTQDPPVTLPPSGVLPPANLVGSVKIKHEICIPPGEEGVAFRFGCYRDTGIATPTIINGAVAGWTSVDTTRCPVPVTNAECSVSQLELVMICEFIKGTCGIYFNQTYLDVPGCTEPTNFMHVDIECANEEAQPKSACDWEGYSSAENLNAIVGDYNPNMCRCVITTPTGTGLSTYINITLVATQVMHRPLDNYTDPEGNLFVQYDDDIEYETVLMSGLSRISMVENLMLESNRQLVLGINHENISAQMNMMFTLRASREIHVSCYDEITDMDSCSSIPCLNGGSCINRPMGFECQCAVGFTGEFCETDLDYCSSNPCLNGGSCINKPMGFECQCAAGFTGQFCEAEIFIENVNPLYGPIAGGTQLTVTGQHFPANASAVLLGTIQCPIIHESSTEIVSLTQEVEESLAGMNLPVSVEFVGEPVLTSDYNYTYRISPVIESIHPLTTIKHGGTRLTISGEYMNSVSKPVLEVTMVIRETTENDNGDFITTETHVNYTEVCDIDNENFDELICRTPAMDDIPDDILDLNNSRNCTQRNNPMVNYKIFERKVPDIPFSENQEMEAALCISVTFYLGMTLDGFTDYKNISEHPDISEYGTIRILPTPTFDIASKVFEKDKMEIFTGEHLASVDQSDYIMWLGLDDCQVLDLQENALTCLPDQNFPTGGSTMKKQEFDIIVGIGSNLNTTIGSMLNRPMLPFFVVGMVLACVLIPLIIIIAVVLTRKKKQKKEPQDTLDDIIHLPDVPSNEWSEMTLDQNSSTVTHDSMGHSNIAELPDVQNNASTDINQHDVTRQLRHIRNKRRVTMDVINGIAITPPALPRRKIPVSTGMADEYLKMSPYR